MITRKRLEQLIKEEKTIWIMNKYCNAYSYDLTNYNYVGIADNKESLMFLDFSIQEDEPEKILVDYLDYLFETKEEAEFSLEFQNITRTETLNLPTWEELNKKVDTIPNMFWQIAKCSEFILFLQTDKTLNNSQIILRGNDDTYNWGLTKENYLEACKIAKKLFLGEE